jgi:anthranilate phosphoribosyltransferase
MGLDTVMGVWISHSIFIPIPVNSWHFFMEVLMADRDICAFGNIITRIINREDLSKEETFDAFSTILKNQTSELQQGAFLSALKAKGETSEEIAGCWEAVFKHDTVKVTPRVNGPLIENCGTGMDSFKTFNISTAAAVVAAAHEGLYLARHGARAITSICGTVDIAEALGVDVECDASVVSTSIEQCGLGLFNGMSPKVHPGALGRILSQIAFGSTLNIAASLASPVKADIGIRGVYTKAMILPVIQTMKMIGYKKALVFTGAIDGMPNEMDEASVCGETSCAELDNDGTITEFTVRPEDVGLTTHKPVALIQGNNLNEEARNFIELLHNKGVKAREDAVLLNAACIFYAASEVASIKDGVDMALKIVRTDKAFEKLQQWVKCQNVSPVKGMEKMNHLLAG